MRAFLLSLFLLLGVTSDANAWWNGDWSFRKKITFNTTDAGAATKERLAAVPVAVRLHTGNFVFADAKPDGTDLRFVASDDKTPLKHRIESWDAANELAVIWVQVPALPPGSQTEFVYFYYGNKKAAVADAGSVYDASTAAAFQFSDKQGAPRDATANGNHAGQSNAELGRPGVAGGSATFNGSAAIKVPPAPSLRITPTGGFSFSAWLKLAGPQQNAMVVSRDDNGRSLQLLVDQTALYARIQGDAAAETPRGGQIAPGAWHHVALSFGGGKLITYVDGKQVGEVAATLGDLAGGATLGQAADGSAGLQAEMDEARFSNLPRSGDWFKAEAAQGTEPKLVIFGEDESNAGSGTSYLSILLGAVTLDGWVVIGILAVMAVVSFWVMGSKIFYINRTARANEAFLDQFKKNTDLAALDRALRPPPAEPGVARPVTQAEPDAPAKPASTGKRWARLGKGQSVSDVKPMRRARYEDGALFRIYSVGSTEMRNRFELARQRGTAASLTPQALNALRASLDATQVREMQKLNSQMVLLTIAISGGPFLGLLGTVVGVMITFAAIAAAGDVNVNSIAPGIAAALVATVAGLAVAIPSLFGYNYLAAKIGNISADINAFVDEFMGRVAENYS